METIEIDATAGSGLEVYEPIRNQLAEMRAANANAVFAYETPKGSAAARSHIYGIRKVRAALEKARKEAKAFFLEQGRRVDSEAKSIKEELDAMIAVHETPLLEIERIEAERVAAIRERIDSIQGHASIGAENSAEFLRAALERLNGVVIDDSFAEFRVEAVGKHTLAVTHLTASLAAAEKREAEEAELARLRAEEAARVQQEREERIAAEAAAKAKAEAEAAAKAEQDAAAERERQAVMARQKAEADAKAAEERAARAAQEERERIARETAAREKAEAEAKAKREADRKHRRAVIASAEDALREIVGTDAEAVVYAIIEGKVPHCRIEF